MRDGRTVLGYPGAAVTSVNDRGTLAGWTILPNAINHATVWR